MPLLVEQVPILMSQLPREQHFSHTDSIHINATPQQVWNLVTRIERTGEWSPVCRSAWWIEPDTETEHGPRAGAWFRGRNEDGDRVWETESQVVVAEEPSEFTWMVRGDAVRWSYELTADGNGTELTEKWAVQPGGFAFFKEKFGDRAEAELEVRRTAALAGIPTTLQAIKQILEQDELH